MQTRNICSPVNVYALYAKPFVLVTHLLAQVGFSSLLHFGQNHGRDLLRGEGLHGAATDVHLDMGLSLLLHNLRSRINTAT